MSAHSTVQKKIRSQRIRTLRARVKTLQRTLEIHGYSEDAYRSLAAAERELASLVGGS